MKKSIRILLEVIWWVVALIVGLAILFPIVSQATYLFSFSNLLAAIIGFTYVRYTISFKTLFFLKPKWTRMCFLLGNIFLFMFVLNRLELVLVAVDSYAMQDLIVEHSLTMMQQKDLMVYIKNEWIFFAIMTFVGVATFNIRLLLSFWRKQRVVTNTITNENFQLNNNDEKI